MKIKEIEHFEHSKLGILYKRKITTSTYIKNVSHIWKKKSSLQYKKQRSTQH